MIFSHGQVIAIATGTLKQAPKEGSVVYKNFSYHNPVLINIVC